MSDAWVCPVCGEEWNRFTTYCVGCPGKRPRAHASDEPGLSVECGACGADAHRRCAEDNGFGDWHEVAPHHERVVAALVVDCDRLLAENAELRRERNAWQTAHQIIEDSVKRNAKSLAQLDAVLDKNEELRTRLARVEALAMEAVGIGDMLVVAAERDGDMSDEEVSGYRGRGSERLAEIRRELESK